ncbi:Tol-Pal system protein TolQ [Paraburkholderia kirstenboschensis]|uniref:MotA/TolQ/ExbB proton channel family protein n=1 Tax=Paraburkholderia kirstenboschensis TaxID=1245436 RepID=UPI000B248CBE|nr:MotA/TolQ/ExbB proton channel family protein [Paraburkholderia kirstenboschensis]CAD6557255.1 Tol-Pal system protein TolQ [Paraburkholderia kirstenboschensis]
MNDLAELFLAVRLGGWVIYPLTVLAVIGLAIILDKTYSLHRLAAIPSCIDDLIEAPVVDFAQTRAQIAALPERHALRSFAAPILEGGNAPIWWIESRAETAAQHIERALNRGLWLLETIVTAAPLLGLLGTIIGMMHSFRLIGGQGVVNPTGVTGGVAQALIATAIGLLIALVVLFAFNYFSRRVGELLDHFERVGTRLIGQLRLDREHAEGAAQLRFAREHAEGQRT